MLYMLIIIIIRKQLTWCTCLQSKLDYDHGTVSGLVSISLSLSLLECGTGKRKKRVYTAPPDTGTDAQCSEMTIVGLVS
uniref:Putative secreted protein n=1 Tax=Anopheles triannulatus TaxID=58253 RepID=A0A2M4B2M3_9DIPT